MRRDQLDLMMKPMMDAVAFLRERVDYNKGRDKTVYSFLAIGVAAIAAVIGIVATILPGR